MEQKTNNITVLGIKNSGKKTIVSIISGIPYEKNSNKSQYHFIPTFKLSLFQTIQMLEKVVEKIETLIIVISVRHWPQKRQQIKKLYKQALAAYYQHFDFPPVILLHKVDLISLNDLSLIRKELEKFHQNYFNSAIQVYQTTINNNSLYYSWSKILQRVYKCQLKMETMLKTFSDAIGCSQVYVLQKNTLLTLAYYKKIKTQQTSIIQYIGNMIKKLNICSKVAIFKQDNSELCVRIQQKSKQKFIMLMCGLTQDFMIAVLCQKCSDKEKEQNKVQEQYTIVPCIKQNIKRLKMIIKNQQLLPLPNNDSNERFSTQKTT